MKVAEKAVSNTIYLALNWLTLTGLSFLYWVIAGKLLLPSEYGKATTAYQIMFFLGSIANLGLGFAVSKVIPELIMKKQDKKIPTIIKFSLKIALSIALVLAILLVLSTPLLNKKLGFNLRDTVFIALGLLFAQLSLFFSRVWYGYQNMKKIWINNTINQIVKLAVAAFLIYSGYRYFGPLAGLVTMYFVSFLLYFSPKIIKDGTRYNTRHLFYELAIPAFFANVFVMIFNNTQYIILSLMKNTESTGYFSLAFMISVQLSAMFNIITSAIFPLVSGLSSVKKKESYNKLITMGIKYGLLIALPAAIFIAIFGKAIIMIFFRPEYLPATDLFLLLLPGVLLFGIMRILLTNLYAIGESRVYRNVNILMTITYLSTAFLFSYLWDYVGMAVSYFVTSLVSSGLTLYYSRSRFKIAISKGMVIRIILASFVLIVAWYGIDLVSTGFYVKMILVLISFILYPVSLKILKVFDENDKRIMKILFSKLGLNCFYDAVKRFL